MSGKYLGGGISFNNVLEDGETASKAIAAAENPKHGSKLRVQVTKDPGSEPQPRISSHDVVLRWFRSPKTATMLGINKNIRFGGCWGCGRGA